MSTKATLAHGSSFHFYREVLDDNYVYLEVEGTQFEAGYGRVMAPITELERANPRRSSI